MENTNRPTTTTATGYPFYVSNRPNGHQQPPPPPSSGTNYPHSAPPPPSGTNYPYSAPPPQNPDPNYYYFNNNNNNNNPYHQTIYETNRRTELLRRLMFSFLIASAVFFTILFIIWLAIRPRFPAFHLTSLTLSSFNISSQQQRVSGDWSANFTSYNPNSKLFLFYEDINSGVYYSSGYSSDSLAQTRIPPFVQRTKELTSFSASYSALGTYVDGNVKGITGDLARGIATFDVRFLADVGFRAGGVRLRRRLVRIFCDDVVVYLKGNGGSSNLTGDGRQCHVWG